MPHASDCSPAEKPTPPSGDGSEVPTFVRSTTSQALTPGQVLGERYQIRANLGSGGMGEVWQAFDLKLRVEVALKSLRPELIGNERGLEILRGEVRSAREVISPNVCRIFDLVVEDGREVVSMEYIDGITLLELLKTKGPLEMKEAVSMPFIKPVAAAGGVLGIRLWDLEMGGSEDLVERTAGQDPGGVAFAGDGGLVTTESGALLRWDLEDGTSRKIRDDPWKKSWAIDVSPDGRYLLSTGGDGETGIGEVVFQDLDTGESRILYSHGERVFAVALDPTGTIAATGDSDGVVRVGPVTGEAPHLLFGHEALVYGLAVGPEGRWIASGGEDENALTGYRVDVGPFPGWETVPSW